MNELENQIIRIIKRAVNCSDEMLDDGMQWEQIFKIGKLHGIIPILCEGILEAAVDKKIKDIFLNEYMPQAVVHFNQMNKLDLITKAFEENGIDYMLLKGKRLKELYPKPEMRSMADLDILIKLEQYNRIENCLLQLGLTRTGESDHEIIWSDGKFVSIELHKRLIPTYNPDFDGYFGLGWDRAAKVSPDKHIYELSTEDEFVFIFAHFAKHYRDGGIGIRHMLDIYLFEKAHKDMDWQYVESELAGLGLLEFYKNVARTLEVWFAAQAATEVTDLITDTVFKSGAYGSAQAAEASRAVKMANAGKNTFRGRIKFILKTAFPPIEVIKGKYPVAQKLPFLLPVFWAVRMIKGVLFKRKTFKGVTSQFASINDKTVSSYRAELDKVGLNTDF